MPTAKRAGRSKFPVRKKTFAIDFHSHISVPEVDELLAKMPRPEGAPGSWLSAEFSARQAELVAAAHSKRTDYRIRLKGIDKLGFDIQAVSMNLPPAYYYADGEQALEIARAANEGIGYFVSRAPDRFVGMCSLPMQDAALAAQELERAVTLLGLKGAWILTNAGGRDLGESEFRPFWAKAQELDVPVAVHPDTFAGAPRLEKSMLRNSVGRPLEEALAMSSMIYEGVMDAYPRLKVSICHGGGFLPYYIGRHDFVWSMREELKKKIKHRPSAYLRRFFYDTVVFDRDNLATLLKKAGDTRILMGSDYPWPVPDPVGFVHGMPGLSKQTRERILSRNAAKLLKLSI